MRITVHVTHVTTAGIADFRPVGVLAPTPVRPTATRPVRTALTRSRSTGPSLRRRPLIATSRPRVATPVVASGDTVVVTVVRPLRHGAGGGPRARPAATLS